MSCPHIRQAYRPQRYHAPQIDKRYEVRKSIGRQREKLNRFRMPEREFTLLEKILAVAAGGSIAGAGIAAAGGVGKAAGDNGHGMVIHDSCGVSDYQVNETYHFKINLTGHDNFEYGSGHDFKISKYCKAGSGNAGKPSYGFLDFMFGSKVKNLDKARQKLDACPGKNADLKSCNYEDRKVNAEFDAKVVSKNVNGGRQQLVLEAEGEVGLPVETYVSQMNPLFYVMFPFLAIAAGLSARRHRRKAS